MESEKTTVGSWIQQHFDTFLGSKRALGVTLAVIVVFSFLVDWFVPASSPMLRW